MRVMQVPRGFKSVADREYYQRIRQANLRE
jgi:hypothetical protein